MGDIRHGTVVTFYSFKGGVGRSFLLANVAAALANWGYRVLCIDWDLEAPGLEYYFRDYLTEVPNNPGLVELIESLDQGEANPDWLQHVVPIGLRTFPGALDLMMAGRQDVHYAERVHALHWPTLYDNGMGRALEGLRDQWADRYDFVLIDSRTGITDIGGICTIQLPDILVPVFVANRQNLTGITEVANRARRLRTELPLDRPQSLILPILSRFEQQVEYALSVEWLERIANELAPFYENWLHEGLQPLDFLNFTKIPYVPFWSYGENLAVLREATPAPGDISYAFQSIAALIARRLEGSEEFLRGRDRYVESARIKPPSNSGRPQRVFISSGFELAPFRQAIKQVIRKAAPDRYEVTTFDDLTASSHLDILTLIRHAIDHVDVMIGLYGFRIGELLPTVDMSPIEFEYHYATSRGIPVIALFADEDAPIPPKYVDRGESASRIDAFRAEIMRQQAVGTFNSPESAARNALTELTRLGGSLATVSESLATGARVGDTNRISVDPAAAGALLGTMLLPGIGTVLGGEIGHAVASYLSRNAPKKIFLSYRRGDQSHVVRVYDALAKRYSPNNVFMDIQAVLPSTASFEQVITDAIRTSTVVIIMVGPDWCDTVVGSGIRSGPDRNSYIRIEARHALADGKRVIPVLIGGAILPSKAELLDDLAPLADLQTVKLRSGADFQQDLDQLMTQIDRLS